MTDRSVVSVVRARLGWLVALVLIASGTTYFIDRSRPPVYESTGLVQITTGQQAAGTFISEESVLQATNQYGELATSARVLTPAAAALHLSPTQLAGRVQVTAKSAGSLRFLATGAAPDDSARVAAAHMRALVDVVANTQEAQRRRLVSPLNSRIETLTSRLRSLPDDSREGAVLSSELQALQTRSAELLSQPSDRASVLRQARPTANPRSPRPIRDGLAVAMLTAVLGAAALYLLTLYRDRFHAADQAADFLGLSLLAEIPRGRLKALPVIEAFRALRTSLVQQTVLWEAMGKQQGAVVVITGAEAQVGKSFVTAGLGRALGAAESSAMVIDGDLRRPSQHQLFGVPLSPGLSDSLVPGGPSVEEVAQHLSFDEGHVGGMALDVVSAGHPMSGSPEAFASMRMEDLIAGLRERDGAVLIDSPPVLRVTDPVVLSRFADGVVVVVDARRSRRRSTAKAVQILRANGATIIGLVYNRAPKDAGSPGYYGYGSLSERKTFLNRR